MELESFNDYCRRRFESPFSPQLPGHSGIVNSFCTARHSDESTAEHSKRSDKAWKLPVPSIDGNQHVRPGVQIVSVM